MNAFEFAGVDEERLYKALRKMGTRHLKTKALREQWSEYNPTRNYCYVIAEFVYNYIAPIIGSTSWILKIPGDIQKHWFIKWPDGTIVDLAAAQFDHEIDYSAAKRQGFMFTPSKRAVLLNKEYNNA